MMIGIPSERRAERVRVTPVQLQADPFVLWRAVGVDDVGVYHHYVVAPIFVNSAELLLYAIVLKSDP